MRTEIEFADHAAGADAIGDLFGVGPELLRDGGGWAVETFTRFGTHNSFVDNSVSSNAPNGTATAQAGGLSTGDVNITTAIDESTISGNQVSAQSKSGQAVMFGAGLSNGGLLKVTNTSVLRNTGHASAAAGSAHGGGIWNSSFGGGPPFGTVMLTNSIVSGNALSAHGGITPVGGGLYTDGPATLTGDHINGNTPDNCSGGELLRKNYQRRTRCRFRASVTRGEADECVTPLGSRGGHDGASEFVDACHQPLVESVHVLVACR